MFTGLISDIGTIKSLKKMADGQRFEIQTKYDISSLELGESIAIDGICLTAVKFGKDSFWVDASLETISCTTVSSFTTGRKVHLERAMQLSGRLGGHLVLGHVDGLGELQKKYNEGNAVIYHFRAPDSLTKYLIDKGSIGINGVSLTVNSTNDDGFNVAIIPHTQEKTNFPSYQPGDLVNLEADIIGKYVYRFLTKGKSQTREGLTSGIDLETLLSAGFSKD